MALFPVIMCGGAGTRLWPASRPSRPKQFVRLTGSRSLFQDACLRVAPLAADGGRLIVVGGLRHREAIAAQLAEIGVEALALLEPEARDSAPAMAAAGAWVMRRDPEAVLAFVASDHHIPDHDAFRDAVRAAAKGARRGRVVTLGVRPSSPSSAYGYIKPAGPGLGPVEAFVEKPDTATAERYLAAGYLWNSGNFIVSAGVLDAELQRHAPAVRAAASAALPAGDADDIQRLTGAFAEAPRISIDYAVMEKTELASVLPVDFAWSDLGAWDAIAATGEGESGLHVLEDADGCLVRAPDGVLVAALGVRDLAIVVEPDAVLVCDLARAQEVKAVVERVRALSPRHLDFPAPDGAGLEARGRRFADWLRLRALPLWAAQGQAEDGAFAELLSPSGRPVAAPRRTRVQARQIHAYARAGALGWAGPWRRAAVSGLACFRAGYVRPDGLFRTLLAPDGGVLDDTAMTYDQAFVLLALASVHGAGLDDGAEAQAVALRGLLGERALEQGGFLEEGPHPYQSNAHMHLLEACLAWEAAGGDGAWAEWADRLVDLALERFIDPESGWLREFFDARWAPAAGDDGRRVEPGHQFEWAWLLARHGRSRGRADSLRAAARLYRQGRKGVDPAAEVALDALDVLAGGGDAPLGRRARLWPQTEWLKAALILAEDAEGAARAALLEDAGRAMAALDSYLSPDGLWRDKRLAHGGFIDEPAPASSLYHILGAFEQLAEAWAMVGRGAEAGLDLR